MIVCFPSTIRQILNLFIRTGLMPNSLTRGTQWSGVRIEACLSLSHRDTRGVRKNCQISAPSPNHVGKERGKVLKTVETSRRNVGKSSYLEKLSLPLFQLTTSISFVNDSQTILSLPTSLDPSLCMALSTTLGIKSHWSPLVALTVWGMIPGQRYLLWSREVRYVGNPICVVSWINIEQ